MNGVLREQVYELMAYAVTAAVLTVYVLLNYLDPETPFGAIKLVSWLKQVHPGYLPSGAVAFCSLAESGQSGHSDPGA